MVKLTKKEVLHIAKLAGLKLTPQEVKKFQAQLSEVLAFVEILSEIDTSEVTPTSQVTGLKDVCREDKVGKSLSQEEVLSGAKEQRRGMFKIEPLF